MPDVIKGIYGSRFSLYLNYLHLPMMSEVTQGVVEKFNKDFYYIDGCSQEEALTIMQQVGELLFNDGISSFGYGGHESGDEIMFSKYMC